MPAAYSIELHFLVSKMLEKARARVRARVRVRVRVRVRARVPPGRKGMTKTKCLAVRKQQCARPG